MSPNNADGMANSIDPDQTAPLFAQTYLSENLGSLRYILKTTNWWINVVLDILIQCDTNIELKIYNM